MATTAGHHERAGEQFPAVSTAMRPALGDDAELVQYHRPNRWGIVATFDGLGGAGGRPAGATPDGRRISGAFLAAILLLCGLVACDVKEQPPPCQAVGEVTVPDSRSALVNDRTASMASRLLPPGLLTALAAEQSAGNGLALIGVDGESDDVDTAVALDPYPGKRSRLADKGREVALACVDEFARAPQQAPQAPGSALVEALNTASRQASGTVYVVSDAESNAGLFNLNEVGFDVEAEPFAAGLAESGGLAPTLSGKHVVWYGLGESTRPLPEAARTNLERIWAEILRQAGATVTFETVIGAPVGGPEGLPADEVRFPGVVETTVGCRQQYDLPAALLFRPDDATLTTDAVEALRPIGEKLRGNPEWTAEITGHTAHFGTARGRLTTSQARASSVLNFLHTTYGIDLGRLSATGVGSTRPARPEIVGGRHDLSAASANRRVAILIGSKGCA